MAYKSEPNRRFLPYRVGDFKNNHPIQQGGQIITPWQKGLQDLAYNQLSLWSQSAPPIIQDAKRGCSNAGVGNLALPTAGTFYDFCLYRYDIPGLLNPGAASGRRYIQVTVAAQVVAGTTWTFRGRTSSGVTATAAASTNGGVTEQITVNIQCPQSGTDYLILAMSASTNAVNVTVTGITARIFPMGTDVLGEGTALQSTIFHPVDSDAAAGQMSVGAPTTVDSVRALVETNQQLYKKNVRGVISFCGWENYTTLPAAKTYTLANTQVGFQLAFTTNNKSRGHQWVYFPRPGVTQLKVWWDGYVVGWGGAGDNATLAFGFSGQVPITWSVAKANALSAVTGWPCDAVTLNIPNTPGPLYLDMLRIDDSSHTKEVRTMSFSVQEAYR